MEEKLPPCVLEVCFVSDAVIGHQIKDIHSKGNEMPEDNDFTPHKRNKRSCRESFSRVATNIKDTTKQTKEIENETPRRSRRKSRVEAKEQSKTQLLKAKKPVVPISSIRDDEENDRQNEESGPENESSDAKSTDSEIQFKMPVEVIRGMRSVATTSATNKSSTNANETKLSKLKTMAEEYFAVHHQKKIVTSDRTLSRLQNPRMTQTELKAHLADSAGTHTKECNRLFKKYITLFPKWIFQLRHGFNILLHGLGSKKKLLEEFRKKMLRESVHIVVNGFFPSLTIKSILNMITEDVLNYTGSFKSIIDQCNYIKYEYSSDEADELFLIVNNIDGPMLRNSKTQNALSYLASSSKIHILASIDHINAPIVWDQNRCGRFNWLWYDTTTFDKYTEETSFENSLLVQHSGSLAFSSLTHVLRSLTPNARGIFKLLVHYQLDNESDSSNNGMSFAELYQKCREKFLVNSDLTLRAQLTEFRDHKLIKFKKGADGVEILSIPIDNSCLKQFMEESDL